MHNLVVEFTENNLPKQLPELSALCLFRVAQEALNNARKHSGTTKFAVELRGERSPALQASLACSLQNVPTSYISLFLCINPLVLD